MTHHYLPSFLYNVGKVSYLLVCYPEHDRSVHQKLGFQIIPFNDWKPANPFFLRDCVYWAIH